MKLKRFFIWMLMLALLMPTLALAEGERVKRVYRVGNEDAVPFAEDAETFDLYVCPILGGDSMVLTMQGQVMLVDMGKDASYETIRAVMEDVGVERIDIAFNSHPHFDHIGSTKKIIEDYEVGVFMTAFPENFTASSVMQSAMMKALHAAEVPVQRVGDGDVIELGDVKMTVMQHEKYDHPNPRSAMLMVEYGDCRLLLTADLTGEAQIYMAKNKDLKADIFKYPHHGLNKLAVEFMEAIDAEYCFITHGYLDSKQAQQQLTKYGIPHDFATWGVIHLSCNGEYWLVEQTLTEEGQGYAEHFGR